MPPWDSPIAGPELRGTDFHRHSTAPESSAYRSKERRRESRPDLTYHLPVSLLPLNRWWWQAVRRACSDGDSQQESEERTCRTTWYWRHGARQPFHFPLFCVDRAAFALSVSHGKQTQKMGCWHMICKTLKKWLLEYIITIIDSITQI